MIDKAVIWIKFLLTLAITWFALGITIAVLMSLNTTPGTTTNALWPLAILVIPVAGAIFAARYVIRKDTAKLKERREAAEAKSRSLYQAQRDSERWEARRFIQQAVDAHRAALQRNVRNALVRNDYGKVTSDKRGEAVLEFLASIGFSEGVLSAEEAIEEVLTDLQGSERDRKIEGFDPTRVPISGNEFEHWVAESLRKFGWAADVTPASGDQGIDVIASKDGLRLGIQCKLYSQAVGNKAIQEAHAGARFHGLHRAAVLSNASFTKSAMDLAATVDVLLISQYDLPELDRKLLRS